MIQQQEDQIVQQFAQQNVSEEQQQFNQAIVRELAIAIKVGITKISIFFSIDFIFYHRKTSEVYESLIEISL